MESQINQFTTSTSVEEILNLEAMTACRVIAGACGLSRMVKWVHCSDLPDASFWLRGGELLLHTGVQSRGANLPHLIRQIHSVGGAALGVSEASDIITQEGINTANQLCVPLILIPDEIRFVDITYAIARSLFDKRASLAFDVEQFWYNTSQIAVKDFESTINYIAQWLNCSVTVFDRFCTPMFTKKSASRFVEQFITPLPKSVFENSHSTQGGFEVTIDGLPQWVSPIYIRSSVFGFLVFSFNEPLDEFNKLRVRHATRLVQMGAVISAQARNLRLHLYSEVLRTIIEGSETSDHEVYLKASDIGFNPENPGMIAIFRSVRVSHELTMSQIESIASEYLHRGMIMRPHHSDIVVWIPQALKDAQQRSMDIIKNIHISLERTTGFSEWKAGIGGIQTGIKGIRLSMREAETAVRRARLNESLFFKDLSAWDVLWGHLQSSLPPETSTTFLTPLTSQERLRLVQTINALMDADFNLTIAARTLSIHRNGLTRRLQRWREKVGLDFTNPKNVLALWTILDVENSRSDATFTSDQ